METETKKTNENVEEKKSNWFEKAVNIGGAFLEGAVKGAEIIMKVSGAIILGTVAVGLLSKKDNANDNAE